MPDRASKFAAMSTPKYSIVIPAYNESERITRTLQTVLAYVAGQSWNAEIIVVNDGSRDATVQTVQSFAQSHPSIRLLENPGNRGKGYSVRHGMLHATGDLMLFTDADLSSPISEAPKLFAAIAAGAEVAIGSRWLRRELQTVKQPFYRRFFGRCYNAVLRLVLGLSFADTQCGFKAFTHDAAKRIFALQRIERWGFDPEILFLARRFGFKTAEIPVQWAHDHRTKISYFRDGMRMLVEMAHVRWYVLRGLYRETSGSPGQKQQKSPNHERILESGSVLPKKIL